MIAAGACALMLGGGVAAWTLGGQARISAAADMKPGLAVCYIYEYVRHVDQIADWEKHRKCEPGAPLAVLDYRVGEDKVLTSNRDDGVMAKITVHSDQFSEVGAMEVAKPGWYPLAIDYFERKGTSTLRFLWRPPGVEGDMPLVPAEALAH
jgi:hypothetical protein